MNIMLCLSRLLDTSLLELAHRSGCLKLNKNYFNFTENNPSIIHIKIPTFKAEMMLRPQPLSCKTNLPQDEMRCGSGKSTIRGSMH